MAETTLERIRAWIHELTQPETEDYTVDRDWLIELNFRYITTKECDDRDDVARCDLCGQQFPLQEMPEVIEHVAGHDEQGAARVDPFSEALTTERADPVFTLHDHHDEDKTTHNLWAKD